MTYVELLNSGSGWGMNMGKLILEIKKKFTFHMCRLHSTGSLGWVPA